MKNFLKRLQEQFINAALFFIFLWIFIAGAAYAAISWPTSSPTWETPGGKFSLYFTNIFTNKCTSGQAISGFSSNGTQQCVSITAAAPAAPVTPFSASASCDAASSMCSVSVLGATPGGGILIKREAVTPKGNFSGDADFTWWMSANSSGTAFASWPTTCANFGTTAPCSQWVSMKDAATGKITSYSYTILK